MFKERVEAIRKLMIEQGIDYWYISGSDPHQSENVAERWRSREWISAFSGSAGKVIISQDTAGLWTDSRYHLQASNEMDLSVFTLFKEGLPEVPTPEMWLNKQFKSGQCLGFDAETVSADKFNEFQFILNKMNPKYNYDTDLLDSVWTDRPEMPASQLMDFSIEFCGESRSDKLKRLRDIMSSRKIQFHLLTSLDDIAWLLNFRASDVAYSPVALSFCIIGPEQCRLCIDESRIPEQLKQDLKEEGIDILSYDKVYPLLQAIPEDTFLYYDPKRVQQKIVKNLPEKVTQLKGTDFTTQMKSEKNPVEIQGMKDAHIQDALALLRWWKWLDESVGQIKMDEISVADELNNFRASGVHFQGLSFSPIIGYRANGAIVHYSASKESAAPITKEGILLVDSGGHYLNGTTDITRTFNLGEASKKEKEHYTLVLKGHINLASVIFPVKTTGSRLETLARLPIWKSGYNYGHGTGHGVGHFLNVHEGPAGISPLNHVPIKAGMIFSNEPGLYFEGEYGIRIENMVVVNESNQFPDFLNFENLTLFPYDLSLIDTDLLTEEEKEYINTYHHLIQETLNPFLNEMETLFLEEKTLKI